MIKKIINWYFEKKYGAVLHPKPPLGFTTWWARSYDPTPYQLMIYFLKYSIWELDQYLNNTLRTERQIEIRAYLTGGIT